MIGRLVLMCLVLAGSARIADAQTTVLATSPTLAEMLQNVYGPHGLVVDSEAVLPDGSTHSAHFNGAFQSEFGRVNIALVQQLGALPIPSPASGFTYSFDSSTGTFVRSTQSFGPILADRAETIGRGRFAFGMGLQQFSFGTFDGLRLSHIPAVFTHDDFNLGGGRSDVITTDNTISASVTQTNRAQPLYQFAGWTHIAHAALGLAIARVAIEEFVGLAGGKRATWMAGEGQLAQRTTIQARVAQAEALVGSGRAYVREATADLWETVSRGDRPSPDQRAVYRLAIAHAMANAVHAVDLMYAAGGATSIYARSRLDRCLRDVHTAAAHVWVAPDTYELAGRLLLGLDPGSTTI
jgi:hypothetical protein